MFAEPLRGFLHDLRGFRHLFRHSYDFELDPKRLSELVQAWNVQKPALCQSLAAFSAWLLEQAGRTDDN